MEEQDHDRRNGGILSKEIEFSPDLLFKHPLEHTWSFWYYENVEGKSWEENQKEVTSFNTVEDFWCLYHHLKPATEVTPGCDYSVFKKGIRPMWEDKMNEKGGRWIIKLESRPRSVDLDEIWLDVIMLMIGERFDENENEICGAILNVRSRCDKISVWTPNCNVNKKKNVLQIGRKLKECLNYIQDLKLHYESHESVEKKTTKNRYLFAI